MRSVIAAALIAVLALVAGTATASAQPAENYQQVTADPPVAVPATASCHEQVIQHDFVNSYYAPAIGTLSVPPACPAPWSKVVLSFSGSVGGVQYDRLADVYVAGVNVFSTSTSEPCCTPGATVSWTWQKDVTEYSPLFTQPAQVEVFLNNVNNSTYTGVYAITVSFTFYETGTGAPAGAHPDSILPVDQISDSGGDGYFTLTKAGQLGSAAVTLPRNLERLEAELFAQGHGPCEEFWWGDPDNCGVATPYREVDVYIDGAIAGAAPVYPVVFTGGDGPGLWEPIPSPRAWYLRPYLVDLTPFAGGLVDGTAHTISLGVSDVVYGSGDYWLVGANLLAWTDHGSTQTQGSLSHDDAPVAPTESNTQDPTGSLGDLFSATHDLDYTGSLQTSAGTVTTSVHEAISESTSEAGVSTDSSWDWKNDVSTSGASTSSTTSDSTYSLLNSSPASFQFSDANQTSASGATTSFSETMATVAVGLALNGAECESYTAGAGGAVTYTRTLLAAGGSVVADEPTSTACSSSTTPAADTPEAPWAPLLLLPAAAAALLAWRRRLRRGG